MSVRGGLGHEISGYTGVRPWLVLHYDRVPEFAGKLFAHDTPDRVDRPAGSEPEHKAGRLVLCVRRRSGGNCGSRNEAKQAEKGAAIGCSGVHDWSRNSRREGTVRDFIGSPEQAHDLRPARLSIALRAPVG